MRRAPVLTAVLMLTVLVSGPIFAGQCDLDPVPAATLLLPYFEVDFTTADPTQALTTFFTINNAWPTPALAQVTLWTNLSLPTVTFQVYLTGYDVQVISLRSLIRDGFLPVTATPSQDTALDEISPHGSNPAWDVTSGNSNFSEMSCNSYFPFRNPAVSSSLLARIQNGHTGQPISSDQCLGLGVGNSNAVGYVTIDNVNSCGVSYPGDFGYFVDGGQGVANNRNQLWGDYFIVDPANAAAYGDSLVHVEAFDTAAQSPVFDFTFYSRFGSLADNREPLPNAWATRYLTGGAFSGGTQMSVWRDPRIDTSAIASVNCGTSPFSLLDQGYVAAFSEREDALSMCDRDKCLPLAVNQATIGIDPLDPPWNNGWIYLDLDLEPLAQQAATDRSQAWIETSMTALGLYKVGYSTIQVHSSCDGLASGPSGTIPVQLSRR